MLGLDAIDARTWEKIWGGIGLLGQGAFTARFLVQWLASERKRETVMPVAFWWFSLTGGLITLTYVIHLGSLSLTLGQSMGLVVYVRNLMLVRKARRREAKRRARAASPRGVRVDAPEGTVTHSG
jgi:lipid-A-disaccharide synthase-like uncharacterized protein